MDEIDTAIRALTNHIKKVVKRCSPEVPASVDRRNLPADALDLLRAKNAALRHAYAYPSRGNLARSQQYITEAFKTKKRSVVVLFDVAKAFDRVWHVGLTYKLYLLEVPDRLIHATNHYLTNRHFMLKHKNTHSSRRLIRAGVPKGSTLPPFLYSAYTNDIRRPSAGVQLALFTDDTALYLRGQIERSIFPHLQKAIDELIRWFQTWRIEVISPKLWTAPTFGCQMVPTCVGIPETSCAERIPLKDTPQNKSRAVNTLVCSPAAETFLVGFSSTLQACMGARAFVMHFSPPPRRKRKKKTSVIVVLRPPHIKLGFYKEA
ncbi:Probable RNA-directed DNA polymerase from transposon BS [Eumeta japonica]|uniref:Probable RNA-directed DNA polymerase from transposon BS n=1 Tax=Eumeta variegata TaxID=151549 RepID=A0A4C1YY70_EUMVA|nr:Probable RNA-directed DNA polymerase from transposon BS [Eumeta japonica]